MGSCNLSIKELRYVDKIMKTVSNPKVFVPKGMSKVLDHLYLGTYDDAVKIDQLKEAGITHVINTVEKCYEYCQTSAEFYGTEYKYFGFTSEDDEKYPIMDHFEDVFKFIESAREANGKCLIHCIAGINRSGSLAVAYVMSYMNIGPISAVQLVFDARGILLTNDTFIQRLVKLASEKNMLKHDEDKIKNKPVQKK